MDINIVDVLFHVPADLAALDRANIGATCRAATGWSRRTSAPATRTCLKLRTTRRPCPRGRCADT